MPFFNKMEVVAAQRLLEEDSLTHPVIDKFTPPF